MGQPWTEPLSTALSINPQVSRRFTPKEIQDYTVVVDHGINPPLPRHGTYFLDGWMLTDQRPLTGVHIIQRYSEGVWASRNALSIRATTAGFSAAMSFSSPRSLSRSKS